MNSFSGFSYFLEAAFPLLKFLGNDPLPGQYALWFPLWWDARVSEVAWDTRARWSKGKGPWQPGALRSPLIILPMLLSLYSR
jgi:hypothetical protein